MHFQAALAVDVTKNTHTPPLQKTMDHFIHCHIFADVEQLNLIL